MADEYEMMVPGGIYTNYGGPYADVSNKVMVKADADSPEVPMPGALVRLYDRVFVDLAWQGLSDKNGIYTAPEMLKGRTYIPMAIDLNNNYEAVAAGPVVAGADPENPLAPVDMSSAAVSPSKIRVTIGVPYRKEVLFTWDGELQSIAQTGALPAELAYNTGILHSDWPTGEPGNYTISYQITDAEGTHEVSQQVELVLLPLEIEAKSALQKV